MFVMKKGLLCALALVSILFASCDGEALFKKVHFPDLSEPPGSYDHALRVSINNSHTGVEYRYTLDGTAPNAKSPIESGGIVIDGDHATTFLKVIGIAPGWISSDMAEAEYTLDFTGGMDPSFSPPGVWDGTFISAVHLQADGKAIIIGGFQEFANAERGRIARLGSDGSLDAGFPSGGSGADGDIYAVAVQPDGRLVIGGYFDTYNGTSRGHVARLESDGSLDAGFRAAGQGAYGPVEALCIQEDGKVLLGGKFTSFDGTERGRVARLNTDGSLDDGFLSTGAGADGAVCAIGVQSNGKIVIGGSFTHYNGAERSHIARLNADGSLDTGFAASTDYDVYSLLILSDDSLLIGGDFTTCNGEARGHIAKLGANGVLDNAFLSSGAGANNRVSSITVLSDGKILIAGDFTACQSMVRERVARLLSDGSMDTSFHPFGSGANALVYDAAVQADGMPIIAGAFHQYGGEYAMGIVRLMN